MFSFFKTFLEIPVAQPEKLVDSAPVAGQGPEPVGGTEKPEEGRHYYI